MYIVYIGTNVYNNINKSNKSTFKGGFLMRITRKQLETKVNSYNSISDIKLKLNNDVIGNNKGDVLYIRCSNQC